MQENIKVCIIDYGLGNLTSVGNALHSLGADFVISSSPEALQDATHIILPGVGSFVAGMDGLQKGGWIEPLRNAVFFDKKPFLGICLGMQLIADTGFENGTTAGLGLIPGTVEKIEAGSLPLPHMGWNNVALTEGSRIAKGFIGEPDFYFVHSYHLKPKDTSVVVGTVEYGEKVTAIIESGNIFGAQFHPEKSQDNGMKLLQNFLDIQHA